MPATYTSSLRLTDQPTGDNANTWGDIADANFGFIDKAIGGIARINMSGGSSYTLTTNNGLADEARCAQILISGIPTSSNSLIIPAVEKLYTVYAFHTSVPGGIKIRTATGTGVAVYSGEIIDIGCEGVSVFRRNANTSALQQSNNLSDLANATSAQANLGLKPEGTFIKSSGTTLELIMSAILSAVYPIGTIYTNRTDNTNPATLFGMGVWASAGVGRVLVGVGTGVDGDGVSAVVTAQSCGGSYTATLVEANLPAVPVALLTTGMNGITAAAAQGALDRGDVYGVLGNTNTSASAKYVTSSQGGNGPAYGKIDGSSTPFNIQPPWYSVYYWVRTS